MNKTISTLQDADIAFFPLKVAGEFFDMVLRNYEKTSQSAIEIIGGNYVPSIVAQRLRIFSENGQVTYQNRPLEFVFLENENMNKQFENLVISDEYFSDCWDKVIDTAVQSAKPITWVLGPSNLLFNLSYALAKEGMNVHRHAPGPDDKPFVFYRRTFSKWTLYDILPVFELPLYKNVS